MENNTEEEYVDMPSNFGIISLMELHEGILVGAKQIPQQEWGQIWALLRFLHSIEGFYLGMLDLCGRHLDRWQWLYTRWERFCTGVSILQQDQASLGLTEENTPIGAIHTSIEEALTKFQQIWVLPFSLDLNWLFARIADIGMILQRSRVYVFLIPPDIRSDMLTGNHVQALQGHFTKRPRGYFFFVFIFFYITSSRPNRA
ncbi:hypothetical protein M422DRAFT_251679 [Sphaerobolus stellatus SS14]|uniref:Uncharacterized protein n=1 Tax=Sphaerobolus stellatus (strain SS14) TaxID=990650 RepID=A0A0C9W0Q6_SPHS4|nr:hypothetical protein M422DRAFT_251679 [Sphaerobolus stellatus SS14]